jgi:hypothetical protein
VTDEQRRIVELSAEVERLQVLVKRYRETTTPLVGLCGDLALLASAVPLRHANEHARSN